MQVEYHRKALFELDEATAWYDEQRSGLGLEFFQNVEECIARLRSSPKQFPIWNSLPLKKAREIRRAMLDRFPYAVVFETQGDNLLVLSISHLKRRPFYWLDRVK